MGGLLGWARRQEWWGGACVGTDPGVSPLSLPLSPGTNMMMVGVHGPKTPCEEVYVKHMGNRVYNVTYTVKEKGDYILIVKWGDESVPGSPFKVNVP